MCQEFSPDSFDTDFAPFCVKLFVLTFLTQIKHYQKSLPGDLEGVFEFLERKTRNRPVRTNFFCISLLVRKKFLTQITLTQIKQKRIGLSMPGSIFCSRSPSQGFPKIILMDRYGSSIWTLSSQRCIRERRPSLPSGLCSGIRRLSLLCCGPIVQV